MAKIRTKKEKQNPHYQFSYTWDKSEASQPRVKRERQIEPKLDYALSTTKKDIIRSLVMTSLILSLELVVYLGWNKLIN